MTKFLVQLPGLAFATQNDSPALTTGGSADHLPSAYG